MNDNQLARPVAAPRGAVDGTASVLRAVGVVLTEDLTASEINARLTAAADATARDRIALAPEVLRAAALLRAQGDAQGYAELRRMVKSHGVPLKLWEESVRDEGDVLRAEAQQALDAQRAARIAQARVELARPAADSTNAAAMASPELEKHAAESEVNGDGYKMEPGRMTFVEADRRGEGEPIARDLAHFSAVILEDVVDRPAPDHDGARTFTLSVATGPDRAPRTMVVPVAGFQRGDWTDLAAGPSWIDASRGTPQRIASLVRALSHPVSVRRYGFTGWTEDRGQPIYVHAGGAIGASGPVDGVRVEFADPVRRFCLPAPLQRDVLREALSRLRLVLGSVVPAELFAALLGAVFRAPLGPTSTSIHIAGRTQSGKSTTAGIAASFFGAAMSGAEPPASWVSATSSVVGLMSLLNTVGDAPVFVDEYKMTGNAPADAAIQKKFSEVLQFHHNRAVVLKNNRDGTPRRRIVSRALLLTSGEKVADGESLRSRTINLWLDEKPALLGGGQFDINDLLRRGASGELAGVTAAYIQWLAASSADLRGKAQENEAKAAARFGLGVHVDQARTDLKLLAPLAYGLSLLGEFVEDVTGERWDSEIARSADALRRLAADQQATVKEENPAVRYLGLLREALSAGHCHLALLANGRRQSPPPACADAWGWHHEADAWRRRGPCVGAVRADAPSVAFLSPGESLAIVRGRAQAQGHPFAADRSELCAALEALGAMDKAPRREGDRGRVRRRIGGAEAEDVLEVQLAELLPSTPTPRAQGGGVPSDES